MTRCAHRSDTDTSAGPALRMVQSLTSRRTGIVSAPPAGHILADHSACWCVGPDACADPLSAEKVASVLTVEHRRYRSGRVKIIGWITTRLADGRRFSCPDPSTRGSGLPGGRSRQQGTRAAADLGGGMLGPRTNGAGGPGARRADDGIEIGRAAHTSGRADRGGLPCRVCSTTARARSGRSATG